MPRDYPNWLLIMKSSLLQYSPAVLMNLPQDVTPRTVLNSHHPSTACPSRSDPDSTAYELTVSHDEPFKKTLTLRYNVAKYGVARHSYLQDNVSAQLTSQIL